MFIDIPDDKAYKIMAIFQDSKHESERIIFAAIQQALALAQEKADTKYVDELIAHSDDTTCYNAYQFITGVENRRRLLNHLNRIHKTAKYE